MWRIFHALLFATLATLPTPTAIARGESVFPEQNWESADPTEAGWSERKLRAARSYAEKIGSSAVLIVQNGRIIASWGDVDRKMNVYSMRKSFMSALYGVATDKHQIDIDKSLADLGIDDKLPELTAEEKTATVRDLLKARSGIYHQAAYEPETMKAKRPKRGSHAPGKFWYYNNWDFNVLGVILRRATGEDTFAAVAQHLAEPLGMQDFRPEDGRYLYDATSEHPAYVMRFTARDLARFGWLYLNRGKWRDRQVIPAEWVSESTRYISRTDRGSAGYGYLWWVAKDGMQFRAHVGRGAFSARGRGGQAIIVSPQERIVVVHLNDRQQRSTLEGAH